MSPLFHITIRSAEDEVFEFESRQPVVHLDLPAGQFRVTVRCMGEAAGEAEDPERTVH